MSNAQYLFKMRIKGTMLKGIFNFQKAVLTNGLIQWHISETEIKCSEINSEKRILINYTIEGRNLLEYKYKFKDPVHSVIFEIQEFSTPISAMKISDTLKMFITDKNPTTINIHIIDREKNVIRKQISTQIQQSIVINVPPDIYSKMPVNLEPDTFHSFMKITNSGKSSKIIVQIQAPDYISFSKEDDAPQSHGVIKKKKEIYSAEFLVSEVKHISKLLQSTNVLGIYQPIKETDLAPLCIRGTIKLIGEFEVFIHRADVVSDVL